MHMCPTIDLFKIFQCDIFSIWVWLCVLMWLCEYLQNLQLFMRSKIVYVYVHMSLYLCVMGWHISGICDRAETKTSDGLFCFSSTYGHV